MKELARFDPQLDPDRERAHTFSVKWHARRRAIALQLSLAGLVLVFNVVLTIYLWITYSSDHSFGHIFRGECERAENINLWTHLAINLLSTLLLGASNYAMQLLVAPTPSELGKAHAAGSWLDIGTASIRNLRWISVNRIVCWVLLGLSSGTLHLM